MTTTLPPVIKKMERWLDLFTYACAPTQPDGLILADEDFDDLLRILAPYQIAMLSGNELTYKGILVRRRTMVFPPND